MHIKTDLEKLEDLKKLTMSLFSSLKRFNKMSDTRALMNHMDNTPKSIENMEAKLNWAAMDHDKLARQVHAASVDCGLSLPKDDYDEIEYNPSPFHKYKYQPRVPLCRIK